MTCVILTYFCPRYFSLDFCPPFQYSSTASVASKSHFLKQCCFQSLTQSALAGCREDANNSTFSCFAKHILAFLQKTNSCGLISVWYSNPVHPHPDGWNGSKVPRLSSNAGGFKRKKSKNYPILHSVLYAQPMKVPLSCLGTSWTIHLNWSLTMTISMTQDTWDLWTLVNWKWWHFDNWEQQP